LTVSVAIVGAGDRGQKYARWITQHPSLARLVAVADPDERRRALVVDGNPAVASYAGWQEFLHAGQPADLVIVSTQDRRYLEPAVSLACNGYNLMLEKPMVGLSRLDGQGR